MENQTQQLNKNKTGALWFIIYAFVTSAVYILPIVKFRAPYVVTATLMLVSILFFVVKETPWFGKAFLLCFISLLLFVFSVLISGATPVYAINEAIRNIRFFLPALWGCFALRYCNKKQQLIFFILFGVLCVFILSRTLVALNEDPEVTRLLAQDKASSNEEINEYRLRNVGGFEFSYMMGIVVLCLVYTALKVKNIWKKLLLIAAIVFLYSYIIDTMYTTLLILTTVGIAILFFMETQDVRLKVLALALAVFVIFALGPITNFLSGAFPDGSFLNDKFAGIHEAITAGDATLMGSRPELLLRGIQNWLKFPLFGRLDSGSNTHSLLISLLESGGLVAFVLWLVVYVFAYKELKSEIVNCGKNHGLLFVAFVYIFVLSLLNPIGYVFELTIAAFFIVPMVCGFIGEQKAVEEEEQ